MTDVAVEKCISVEMWKGSIPIKYCLADSDLSSLTMPDPFYCLSSRLSYMAITAEDAIDYFRSFAIDISADIWFSEWNDTGVIPLKTNLPIGVLYDTSRMNSARLNGVVEPWKIVIHFRNFPHGRIFHCSSRIESETFYFHALKQALYLLSGHTRSFSNLSKETLGELWKSICESNRSVYEDIAKRSLRPAIVESTAPLASALSHVNEDNHTILESPSKVEELIASPVAIMPNPTLARHVPLRIIYQRYQRTQADPTSSPDISIATAASSISSDTTLTTAQMLGDGNLELIQPSVLVYRKAGVDTLIVPPRAASPAVAAGSSLNDAQPATGTSGDAQIASTEASFTTLQDVLLRFLDSRQTRAASDDTCTIHIYIGGLLILDVTTVGSKVSDVSSPSASTATWTTTSQSSAHMLSSPVYHIWKLLSHCDMFLYVNMIEEYSGV